jgi:agmatinase
MSQTFMHALGTAMDIQNFDPNGVGNVLGNIFGLPFSIDNSRLVFIPVPWDVTVSNHEGTCHAPGLILEQSSQIDLYDPFSVDAWKKGMAMEPIDDKLLALNARCRERAVPLIRYQEQGGRLAGSDAMIAELSEINLTCAEVIDSIMEKCLMYAENRQLPFVIGGDHSVSLGNMFAMLQLYPGLGILQIDAHADFRLGYQGFFYSHASVMRNVMDLEDSRVGQLVQVGLRELCDDELLFIEKHPSKISAWYDRDMHARLFKGETWHDICGHIIERLPGKVYVSFDMDGLDPALCPHTGTPVPGGLSYNQAMYLLEMIVNSGRKIVGADLVETGPNTFDAMMACRIIYRMAGMMLKD